MAIRQHLAGLTTAGAALLAAPVPAFAHHVIGGKMPATLAHGFLAGLGHPIIGIDHFLFIVGVGLLAGIMGRRILLPLAFILGTWGGAALHLAGLNVPLAEVAIVASVILMAVAVIADVRAPAALVAGLIVVAGIFHGHAYAESIFGAEPTPLYAYLAGFAVIQFVIAFAAAAGLGLLQKRHAALAQTGMRVAGGAMVGVALVAISNMAFGP